MTLATNYLGLKLKSPLVVAAGPISRDISNLRKLEDSGAAAVVLKSLFEQEVEYQSGKLDFYLHYGAERFAESITYFPEISETVSPTPEEYLDYIREAKKAVDIPIIASLNGSTGEGWVEYATQIEQAGADALEMNLFYLQGLPQISGEHVELVYLNTLKLIRSRVRIPIAVKMAPYFSSVGNMMLRLSQAGANGLVLFNRFYQPDINVKEMSLYSRISLSAPEELLQTLRWIGIMYEKVDCSLAASGGIHHGVDVAKSILVGADVAMLYSALLKYGLEHLAKVREELEQFMEERGYSSVLEMRGALSQRHCETPEVYEQANYMKDLAPYGPTSTLE